MTRLLPLIALAFVAGCASAVTSGPKYTGSVKPSSPEVTGSIMSVNSAASYCNRIADPSQRSHCLGYYGQF